MGKVPILRKWVTKIQKMFPIDLGRGISSEIFGGELRWSKTCLHGFLRFLQVFHGFSRFLVRNPQLKISKISRKIRFSQNRFYACSDGKYGFKTCLRHQEDSFHAKYHHFESFKGLLKNSNFWQKCDFLGFFEIFDLWVIFRFFAQNRLKMALDASKSFSGSPNTLQIHWMTSYDDLKTI